MTLMMMAGEVWNNNLTNKENLENPRLSDKKTRIEQYQVHFPRDWSSKKRRVVRPVSVALKSIAAIALLVAVLLLCIFLCKKMKSVDENEAEVQHQAGVLSDGEDPSEPEDAAN